MNRLILSILILFVASFPAGAQNNSTFFPDPWSVHAMTESEGRLYAATNTGLFISDDEGGTWTHVPEMEMFLRIVVALDGKVFATDGTALYRLEARDGKWKRINVEGGVYFMYLRVVGNALVATDIKTYWTSIDGGLTWSKSPTSLAQTSTRSLGVSPQGHLFASGPDGHYLSKDSGASWEARSNTGGNDPSWDFQAVFSSDGSRVYFVSQDRHVRISPGDSIVFSNPIDSDRPVMGVIGKYLLVGRSGGMSRSSDNGGSFQPAEQGLGSGRTLELAAGGLSVFARQTDGIYRSRDSGATWQKLLSGDSVSRGLVVRGQEVFCIMKNRLYHSLDDGGNWTWEEDAAHPFVLEENFRITTQLAFTSQGLVQKAVNGTVWFTRNRGRSWDSLWAGEAYNPVNTLAVRGDRIYVALWTGIRVSDDFGKTWKDPNLLSSPVSSQIIATRGREIFAAGMRNIHRSPDSGNTWVSMSQEGLDPEAQFTALAFSGDTLYAGIVGDPRSGLFFSVGPGSAWKPAPADPLLRNINALHALPGRLLAGQMRGPMFAYSLSSRSWTDAGPDSAVHVQGFFAGPKKLFAFSYGSGIYSSPDGGSTWESSRSGLATYDVLSLASLDGLHIGTARDGLFTRSSLPDWTRGTPQLPGQIRNLATDGAYLFALVGNGEIARLPRGGGDARVTRLPAAVTLVNGLAVGGGNLYAATNAGLFAAGLPGPASDFEWRLISAGSIQAVAVQGPNVAMVNRRIVSGGNGIDLHLSRDAGATFPDSLRISFDHREKIVVAFASGGDLLIGGARGLQVRRIADGKMEKLVEGVAVHSIAVRGGTWALGMHEGVFYTKDGVTWKSFDTAPAPTYAVAFSGDTLFAGGGRRRVDAFHVEASSIGIDRGTESREAFPQAARLIAFQTPTGYSLRYMVPGECRLTLTLASLDGRSSQVFTGLRHSGGHHAAKLPNGLRGPMRYILEVFPIEGRAGRPQVQSGWLGSVKK